MLACCGLLLVSCVHVPRGDGEAGDAPGPAGRVEWPQFRGPLGTGVAPAGPYPLTWDTATGKNVAWSLPLRHAGHSSPVVWDGRVFLTGESEGKGWLVCVDAVRGSVAWETAVVTPAPDELPEGITGGLCASTPAVDGSRVYALFASADIVCTDLSGNLFWRRKLCSPVNGYGLASSLVLWRETVLVQLDQGNSADAGLSEILALDKRSGRTVWSTKRPVPNSWSTPVVIRRGGAAELVTCANPWVISYDPDTGAELWRARGLDGDVVPMAVPAGGLVLAANAGSRLLAIRPGGRGDVTSTRVAWTGDEGLPSLASPVTDGRLVLLAEGGGLTCLDAATGALRWQEEAGTGNWASPVLAGRRVYVPDASGRFLILELGDRYRRISEADVREEVTATPAFAGGRVYVRTKGRLVCCGPADRP